MGRNKKYEGVTVEIIQPVILQRKDSFWYDGQVAVVSKGSMSISVEAQGEIQVTFNRDEDSYRNQSARDEALHRNYSDKKLNKLNNHDGWGNNNWFAFYDLNTGEYLTDTCVNYDDAIEIAQEYVNNELTN